MLFYLNENSLCWNFTQTNDGLKDFFIHKESLVSNVYEKKTGFQFDQKSIQYYVKKQTKQSLRLACVKISLI